METKYLNEIADQFLISGKILQISKVSTGHIHASFVVSTDAQDHYFLQQINHQVFNDIDGLMHNLELVTRHLTSKSDYHYQVLTPVKTTDGSLYLAHDNSYWRMFDYLEGLVATNQPNTIEQVRNAAIGLADFLGALADLPGDLLHLTIPEFHHIDRRYQQLNQATLAYQNFNQKELGILEQIDVYYPIVLPLIQAFHHGVLPIRVTHNDTKFNNLMFDKSGKVGCVVDLDTVMPGTMLFDLGDALRTLAATADEDETDLSKVGVNATFYQTFKAAFLDQFRAQITDAELQFAHLAAGYMALIMAIRFMTDHLNGDVYFGTHYRGHNLDRAATQVEMTKAFFEIEKIF